MTPRLAGLPFASRADLFRAPQHVYIDSGGQIMRAKITVTVAMTASSALGIGQVMAVTCITGGIRHDVLPTRVLAVAAAPSHCAASLRPWSGRHPTTHHEGTAGGTHPREHDVAHPPGCEEPLGARHLQNMITAG